MIPSNKRSSATLHSNPLQAFRNNSEEHSRRYSRSTDATASKRTVSRAQRAASILRVEAVLLWSEFLLFKASASVFVPKFTCFWEKLEEGTPHTRRVPDQSKMRPIIKCVGPDQSEATRCHPLDFNPQDSNDKLLMVQVRTSQRAGQ